MQFLKDNWLWVVAPIVLFVLVALALVVFGSDAPEPDYHLR